jgi:4'-phosphopantetheinyl transferase
VVPDADVPASSCRVWWAAAATDVSAGLDPSLVAALPAALSAAEHERWRAFRFAADAQAYLVAHAMTRIIAGHLLGRGAREVRFARKCLRCGGPHGKPALPGTGLELSITHTRGRVGVAFTRGVPVGLDVEALGKSRESAAAIALSPAERAVFERLPGTQRAMGILRYWTRKEALLKATGYGLALTLSGVTVSGPCEAPAVLSWPDAPEGAQPAFLADLEPGRGYLGSLATLGTPLPVSEQDAGDVLASWAASAAGTGSAAGG